jgi:hypothetical protein
MLLGIIEQNPEARSQKPEARSQKPEARSQKPEARSQEPEARSQKTCGSRTQEVPDGGRRQVRHS